MNAERLRIEIEGKELPQIHDDLIELEVELDDELAAQFRLHLSLPQQQDNTWAYLDDESLRVWQQVTIKADFEDADEELFVGVITSIRPLFEANATRCTIEICGLDNSVLMDRVERRKDWPNKKDSEIADELFARYGLTPEVEDTTVVHDEAISTIIQCETDIQFLDRLALRNGFECYVEGTTGYFRAPRLDEPPQPTLAIHCDEETNLVRFSVEVDALASAPVTMVQLDRASKELIDVQVDAGQQPLLGRVDANGLLGAGIEPGLIVLRQAVTTGAAEMEALCRSLYQQGQWFVNGEGEIAGNAYGHVLLPRRTVAIKGIGETYGGIYYVRHVTHRFTTGSYTQHFKVRRNALLPRGDEPFAAAGGLL
ncbi:MAG: phage late control D family protein [Chloroflexales bacterium]|nr:phage late control D family protein [Chloroflexales bacterium]